MSLYLAPIFLAAEENKQKSIHKMAPKASA